MVTECIILEEPPIQEVRFLEQVKKLIHTSNMAREEAESYAAMIEDPQIKAEAMRLLDF